MGIRIYSYIKAERSKFDDQLLLNDIDFTYLFFDLNYSVYLVLNHSEIKKNAYPNDKFYELFYTKFFELITEIINLTKPKVLIYFTFDGVSPCDKFKNQLSRRLLRIKTNGGLLSGIDSASITAGTEFMHQLHLKFDTFIRDLKKNNKLVKNLNVYYSSCYEPGEGEFKIFHFIKQNKLNQDLNYALFGKDGDLIIYGLAAKLNNLIIINKYQLEDEDYSLIKIRSVRELFLAKFNHLKDKNAFDYEHILMDLIFIFMFIGTDFLNPIPGFTCAPTAIRNLINLYIDFQNDVNFKYLTQQNGLNINNLKSFVDSMKIMDKILEQKVLACSSGKNEAKLINDSIKKNYYEKTIKSSNFKQRRNFYLTTLTSNYIKAMFWNLKLYYTELLSWHVNFDLIWPPYISEFMIDERNLDFTYELSRPLTPLCSLIYVLPANSILLLPASFRNLKNIMTPYNANKELKFNKLLFREFYFDIDQPFGRAQRTINSVINNLSREEKERNQVLPLYLYVFEDVTSTRKRLVRKEL